MARYKFSVAQRVALWKAHKKCCVYSGEPLNYKDLHIDHILPESLLSKPEELKSIIKEYGLNSDFDINSYYNLIPTLSRCNLQKGSKIFKKSTALFYLEIAEQKYSEVLKEEKKFKE